MSKHSQYKWLMVVEGFTDILTYKTYLYAMGLIVMIYRLFKREGEVLFVIYQHGII